MKKDDTQKTTASKNAWPLSSGEQLKDEMEFIITSNAETIAKLLKSKSKTKTFTVQKAYEITTHTDMMQRIEYSDIAITIEPDEDPKNKFGFILHIDESMPSPKLLTAYEMASLRDYENKEIEWIVTSELNCVQLAEKLLKENIIFEVSNIKQNNGTTNGLFAFAMPKNTANVLFKNECGNASPEDIKSIRNFYEWSQRTKAQFAIIADNRSH